MDSSSSILSSVECLKVYIGDATKPVNLYLEGESKSWHILLNELIGGKVGGIDCIVCSYWWKGEQPLLYRVFLLVER